MLAIIPARGGSKRFPRKNLAKIKGGETLLRWAIELPSCFPHYFEQVVVSTEDSEIRDEALKSTGVLVVDRSKDLASDNATVWQVCENILTHEPFTHYEDFGVFLPTSPLRTASDLIKAYKQFKESNAECLMSVTPYDYPPGYAMWIGDNGKLYPENGMLMQLRNDEQPKFYRHDGSFIFCKTEAFIKNKEFYGLDTIPYIIPRERAVDINEPIDLKWAEFLMGERRCF